MSDPEKFAHLPSGIDLCYQSFGTKDDPTILLIMGLGGPMGWWRTDFCEQLADRGFHVIRFDNRDTGRSTKMRQHRVSKVDIVSAFVGRGKAPYGLGDFASDAVALLDSLGIEQAHLVGVSMGGMIAQEVTLAHPDRVLSLTSIMSTTGKKTVGRIHPKVIPAMLSSRGRTRNDYVESTLSTSKMIGSPAFPTDDDASRERARETYDRGWIASGVSRHIMAVLTQRDRTDALADVKVPTMVIHGSSDVMVHKSGGRATADAVTGAEHLEIAGMGHDLPPQLDDPIIEAIVRTTQRADLTR
jgi:pimeloyl-ACP methyl ester carboxylesterase